MEMYLPALKGRAYREAVKQKKCIEVGSEMCRIEHDDQMVAVMCLNAMTDFL
jgi:hypothetical protein